MRVFGGQVVAQSLVAANQTVDSTHRVNSLHGYFLRGGDHQQPIELTVDRLREGRAFSARRVTAAQDGRVIFVLSTSFHRPEDGGDYQQPAPLGVPGPEHLPTTHFSNAQRIETRDASYDQATGAVRRLWFRSVAALPVPLHAAAVAYASDHGLFGAARRIVDVAGAGTFDSMFRTSLDHAIWFHRQPDVSDWLLYDIEAIMHFDERILAQGKIYDRAGRRVATVTQEMLARAPG
jgi:acyl-CoA thioesterase-2